MAASAVVFDIQQCIIIFKTRLSLTNDFQNINIETLNVSTLNVIKTMRSDALTASHHCDIPSTESINSKS